MKYICYFVTEDKEEVFNTLIEAQIRAEQYCGNNCYNKPFTNDQTYLYGLGDGYTAVIVRRTKQQ